MNSTNLILPVSSEEESILRETMQAIVNKNSNSSSIEEVNTYFLENTNNKFLKGNRISSTSSSIKNINEDNNSPWTKSCRLCATMNNHLIPIFDNEGIEHQLCDKIHKYLPIRISETDSLPLKLCYHCAAILLAWNELSEGCINAQNQLVQMQTSWQKQSSSISNVTNNTVEQIEQVLNEESQSQQKECTEKLDEFQDESPSIIANKFDRSKISKMKLLMEYRIPQASISPETKPSEENDNVKENIATSKNSNEEVKSNKVQYNCSLCEQTFSRSILLKRHKTSCHKRMHRKSDISKNPEMLKPRRKKLEPYCCIYCDDFVANGKRALIAHYTEIHADIHKKNTKIERAVDNKDIASAKMEVDGKIYYHCKDCGKNLHSPYTFSWHMRIHTGERPFTCHLCGKQFRVNQGLARHLRETHAGIKNFPCDICGRMFSTKRNAEDHRRIHTGERPYVCNVCGKSFKQKASLFVHNRTHSDYFPFKCSYCEQGFRTKPSLMVHITKHTGEKPFACDICQRRFRIKYELKRHRLVHFDEKPWQCENCDLSFRQKRYLVNHRKLNHSSVSAS